MQTRPPQQGEPQFITASSVVLTCPNLFRYQQTTRAPDDICNGVWCPACSTAEQALFQQEQAALMQLQDNADATTRKELSRQRAPVRGKTDGLSRTRAKTGSATEAELAERNCCGRAKHHFKHMERRADVSSFFVKSYRGTTEFPTTCAICAAPIYAGKKETWQSYFTVNNIDASGNKLPAHT